MSDKETKMGKISITVPEDLLEQFKKVSKKQHRSASSLMTVLIERYLQEIEREDMNQS